jgi:hypothetical protein
MQFFVRATFVALVSCGSAANNGGASPPDGATDAGSGADASAPSDASPDAGTSPPEASTAAFCTNGVRGTWQDITPPPVRAIIAGEPLSGGLPSPGESWGTTSIAADPWNPSTLYVSADGQGIFKSLDCGGTWARVDDPSDRFSKATGSVYAWAFVIDPTDPQVIYANNGYGVLGVFKSSDGAQSFTQTFAGNLVGPGVGAGSPVKDVFIYGGFVGSIRLDPSNHLHVLVSPHHSCNPPYPEYCLLETFDGAATWTVLSTNIAVANADGPWSDLTDSSHYYIGGTPQGGLYQSSDGGRTWSTAPGINGDVYGPVHHSGVTGKYLLGSANGVLQSADGLSWSVIPNTPVSSVNSDGANLYGSRANPPLYFTASEQDPSVWSSIATPTAMIYGGGGGLYVDRVNGFLYSANLFAGTWRYSTK